MIVVFLDPGKLTGLSSYNYETGTFKTRELNLLNLGSWLEAYTLLNDEVSVGWESFRITAATARNTQAPWSLEAIGVARYISANYGYTILPEAAPGERLVATPAMLRAIGWKTWGKDSLSASQHLLAWMLRERRLPQEYEEGVFGCVRS
jgi:hypothetical protein